MRLHALHALLALVAVAAVPATTSAATPQPPDCPLYAAGPAKDYAIALPGGGTVSARNPYGATLARNRLFFDFSVRGGSADLANVQKVEWAMDGTTVRTDPTAPFAWAGLSGSSKRMPAGDHTIKVTAFTAAGQASTQFAIGASDCQPASSFVELPKRAGTSPVRMAASSSFEGPITAPPLDRVAFTATKNVVAALPASVRGRTVGRLEVTTGANQRRTYTLRAPRRGTTLLRKGALTVSLHPGRKRLLDVTGLPAGTSAIDLFLSGRGTRLVALRSPLKAWAMTTTLTAGQTSVSVDEGGRFV
jgi:hypothetical protein